MDQRVRIAVNRIEVFVRPVPEAVVMSHTTPDDGAATGRPRVVVIGGGVAGLTAATYTARAGFDTVVLTHGESILRRNAHLENVPGFPAGINPRLFSDLLERQAERNGCLIEGGIVTAITPTESGFEVRADRDEESYRRSTRSTSSLRRGPTRRISKPSIRSASSNAARRRTSISTTTGEPGWTGCTPPAGSRGGTPNSRLRWARCRRRVDADSRLRGPLLSRLGRTGGYFTDRGRDVPPGCEEIGEAERRRRERESMAVMTDAFETPHPDRPTMHPSLRDDPDDE